MVPNETDEPIDPLASEYRRFFGGTKEFDEYKCEKCKRVRRFPHHEDDFPTTTYCGDHGAMNFVGVVRK